MDIIIPYMFAYEPDLRYCLRSLEKFGPQADNIYIVGERLPPFVDETKVIHVMHVDCYDDRFKEKNLRDKVLHVLKNYKVSTWFLYLHDDHFMTSKFREVYWYDKTLFNKIIHLHPDSVYRKTLQNTVKSIGMTTLNYDVHAPMFMNSLAFESAMKTVDWEKYYGYALKSLYMAYAMPGEKGCEVGDCKIKYPSTQSDYTNQVHGREWFSTENLVWDDMGEMKHFLSGLYPDRSRWEK